MLKDLPVGSEFGIDYKSWNTGEKFLGLKMIPPGVHFVYVSMKGAPRIGELIWVFFVSQGFALCPRSHFRWDCKRRMGFEFGSITLRVKVFVRAIVWVFLLLVQGVSLCANLFGYLTNK